MKIKAIRNNALIGLTILQAYPVFTAEPKSSITINGIEYAATDMKKPSKKAAFMDAANTYLNSLRPSKKAAELDRINTFFTAATTTTTTTAKKTWQNLAPYRGSVGETMAALKDAVKGADQPLTDGKKQAQNTIMEKIVNATGFDETNIQNPSQAAQQLQAAPNENAPGMLVSALMLGFCAKANQEGGASGSAIDVVAEINGKFRTQIPGDANADALLTLAVMAPLPAP